MDAAKIVGLKIKRLRQSKEWSQTDLGDKVGLSQVYISKIERGDADPDTELMVKFSEAFDVKIAELFGDIPRTGAVQSAGTAGRGEGRHRVRLNESIESFGNVRYPIVSHIRAGNGTIDKYRVESDDSMEGPSDPRYKGALFFEVKGQSMEPRWEEGDFVLAHPNMKIEHGDYGVVCYDREEGCLKRVYYRSEKIVLHSLNPSFEPIIIDPDAVWFAGKVIWTKHK